MVEKEEKRRKPTDEIISHHVRDSFSKLNFSGKSRKDDTGIAQPAPNSSKDLYESCQSKGVYARTYRSRKMRRDEGARDSL